MTILTMHVILFVNEMDGTYIMYTVCYQTSQLVGELCIQSWTKIHE